MFTGIYFDETTAIGSEWSEREGEDFAISSATVTVTNQATGVKVRTEVACVVDGHEVYLLETFSAANGYVSGGHYRAVFSANITAGLESYVEKHADLFVVTPG